MAKSFKYLSTCFLLLRRVNVGNEVGERNTTGSSRKLRLKTRPFYNYDQ